MYTYKYNYNNFPKWTDEAEGMVTVPADEENLGIISPFQVKYAEKDGCDLHIRFMFPEKEDDMDRKYPLIMHVRGSGWEKQNLEGIMGSFAPIVHGGYAIAIIEYRPYDVAKYPGMVLDLKTAARWIWKNIDLYPIDRENIFLSGDSSGGHTAVMGYLTWNEDVLDNPDETDPLPPLRGLLDYYGVTNVLDLANRETGLPAESNHLLLEALFESEDDYQLANFNCFMDLREQLEPVLIIHGNKDRLVPLSHSTDFFSELQKRNVESEMYMVDGADHGGSFFWYTRITDIIMEFLNSHCR